MAEVGWSHLNSRFGNLDSETSPSNIASAVHEMFHEDVPGLLEGDYAEHSSMWINHGFDDGPEYTLSVHRRGLVTLEKRLDQDDLDPVEYYKLENVHEHECVALCTDLVSGKIDVVLSRPWTNVAL